MSTDQYLESLDDQSIIEVIERPENIDSVYREKALDELKKRVLSPQRLNRLAGLANTVIASRLIKTDELLTDKVCMHQSLFLSNEEIKNIYTDVLKQYIAQKDQFRFDVWSYAIGGI